MNDLSVIIPSYNSAATIGRTLEGLLAQKPAPPKEIIVVDSSDDGRTPAVLSDYEKRGVRVIRLAKKTMPAIGRNLGAKEASGRVMGFIDSDAYPAEDWAQHIGEAYADGCRVGGGAILLPPEQRDHPLALAQYFIQFNEFMEGGARRPVRFTPSCNLFCEKKLFEEAGGFPEIRAAEDVLFGLWFTGREPFYFDPAIRVSHIFLETWRRYRTNQVLLGQYTLEYRRRHFKSWIYRGVAPILFLPVFLAGKFARISYRICRSRDKALRLKFFMHLPLFCVGMFFLAWGVVKACFEKEA